MPDIPHDAEGFTLVEMLVAVVVFGLLATAGTSLLMAGVTTQTGVRGVLNSAGDEQRISALIGADLLQAVARPTRDVIGRVEPAFGGPANGRLMSYVRAGWVNSTNAPRAELQRVELRLEGQSLLRVSRPMLDGATTESRMVLADDIASASVRLRDAKGRWGTGDASGSLTAMPAAAELILVRRDGVSVKRIFLVGAGE